MTKAEATALAHDTYDPAFIRLFVEDSVCVIEDRTDRYRDDAWRTLGSGPTWEDACAEAGLLP